VSKCAKAHLQQSRISKFFWRKTRNRTLSGESVRAERVGLGEREIGEKKEGRGREALPQTKIYNYTTAVMYWCLMMAFSIQI